MGQPLIDNRITAAIESELAAKGMTKKMPHPTCRGLPRGLRQAARHHRVQQRRAARCHGYRYGGGWATTDVRVNEILVGTLVIDVADRRKRKSSGAAWA